MPAGYIFVYEEHTGKTAIHNAFSITTFSRRFFSLLRSVPTNPLFEMLYLVLFKPPLFNTLTSAILRFEDMGPRFVLLMEKLF